MKTKSLRFRLIYWYFTAFFLSTVIIFSVFYTITKNVISDQTDKEITLHGSKITDLITAESSGVHGIFPKLQLEREFSQIPGMLVVISDNTGKIQSSSQSVDSEKLIFIDILQKSANIVNPVFLNIKIGVTMMRSGIFPVISENGVRSLVLVAHPVEAVQKSLDILIWVLLFTIIVIGILSVFGGYIVARGALQPIVLFSERLKRIESDNLNQKIPDPKTGDEIEELTAAFNLLLERLNKSFEREQQFIGDIAHELKTPLSVLKNTIEVTLSKKRPDSEYKNTITDILIDINKLSSTINDVLDLAWTKSADKNIVFEKINLSDLMKEMEELLQKLSTNKRIQIKVNITGGIFINGHHQKLYRALYNLIDNAVKYTPQSGEIKLTLSKENNHASVDISNTGPGIKREDLPLIFNRFYRGNKSAKVFGSGLGLAICKSIIEAHGGTISINSIINKKTAVKITFPLLS